MSRSLLSIAAMAILLGGTILAYAADDAPVVTAEDLRVLKKSAPRQQHLEAQKILARLDAQPEGSVPGILAFLREALVEQDSDEAQLAHSTGWTLYRKLCGVLGRFGSEGVLDVLVDCMTHPNPHLWKYARHFAVAVVALSDRYDIDEAKLQPLLTHTDAVRVKLGHDILEFIRYDSLMDDRDAIRRTLQSHRSQRTHGPADKRRDALDERVRREGVRCFDDLVAILESDEQGPVVGAAVYHLYQLTGHHFPTWYRLGIGGRGGEGVNLRTKAAKSWRHWKANLEGGRIPEPDRESIRREERLAAFERDSQPGREKGPEYDRPSGEVIDELLSSSDPHVRDLCVDVLSRKTLDDEQVGRLIQAAKAERAGRQRVRLWRVLDESRSEAGRRFLRETLLDEVDEGLVVQFVHSIRMLRSAQTPLLTALYEKHPSPLVKDAMLLVVIKLQKPSEHRLSNPARDLLLRWIVKNTTNGEHLVEALGYARVLRLVGLKETWDALERDISPRAKKKLYKMALKCNSTDFLIHLLNHEKDEEFRLAGLSMLDEHIRYTLQGPPAPAPRRLVQALGESKSAAVSPAARTALDDMLTCVRQRAIENAIEKHRGMMARLRGAVGDVGSADESRMLLNRYEQGLGADHVLTKLRREFVDLPEEEAIKTRVDAMMAETLKHLRERLDKTE